MKNSYDIFCPETFGKIKKYFVFSIVILLNISYLHSQNIEPNNCGLQISVPEAEGMSSERLARIDTVFREYINKDWCNGATAIILRNGKIVYYKAIGYNDIKKKTPLKKDDIFRIASQTKAITSVAVMMLYEKGKFSLDDPISDYLPEFKDVKVLDKFNEADSTFTTVKPESPVTIRELLTHTSGLGYPGSGTKAMNAIYANYGITMVLGDKKLNLKDDIRKLARVPLGFQPGEKWNYGFSVDVLGRLVEVISGMSLDRFFRNYIFDPLGMKDTYFYLPKDKYKRLEKLYIMDKTGHLTEVKKSTSLDPDYPDLNGKLYSGGAGLSSTVYDYALFLKMLLNGGVLNGKRLLSETTVKMMTQNQIGDLECGSLFIPKGGDKFGLGFEIISKPGSIQIPIPAGSYGWGGTFGSLDWVDPVNNIVAQLVLQVSPNSYNEIRKKFIALVYQAIIN
ncbi:MAG: serine hydrolase domain-containing protein [Ignavibacteriaceae bacterium]